VSVLSRCIFVHPVEYGALLQLAPARVMSAATSSPSSGSIRLPLRYSGSSMRTGYRPGPGPDDGEHPGPQIDIWPAQAGCFTAAQTTKRQASHDAQPVRSRYGQERRNLRPAPGLTDLQLISTPSAIALHVRLARCDHGRSSSSGGEGDDRGGTSQRSVNAERSTNCSVLVTLPSLPALAAPALPFPGYEVGIRCAAMC
jgi:hypothetical protein